MEAAPVLAALCPVSGGREAVEFGLAAAGPAGGGLIVVAVVGNGEGGVRPLALQRVAHAVGPLDVRVIEDETPAGGLARALDDLAPALIALGARRGPERLGTTARRILHVSACPVAIVPPGYTRPPAGLRAVGAAFAPGPEARHAIHMAAALARAAPARLRVIGQRGAAVRQAAAVLAAGAEVDLRGGEPADGLIAATAELDLLVLGSRASGPPRAVRLDGVSRAVVDRAFCPVLVLPRGGYPGALTTMTGRSADSSRPRDVEP